MNIVDRVPASPYRSPSILSAYACRTPPEGRHQFASTDTAPAQPFSDELSSSDKENSPENARRNHHNITNITMEIATDNTVSFTPRRTKSIPRAWERRPATPHVPRREGDKIWKRVVLGELGQESNASAHVSKAEREGKADYVKVTKKLKVDFVPGEISFGANVQHSNLQGTGGFVGTKFEEEHIENQGSPKKKPRSHHVSTSIHPDVNITPDAADVAMNGSNTDFILKDDAQQQQRPPPPPPIRLQFSTQELNPVEIDILGNENVGFDHSQQHVRNNTEEVQHTHDSSSTKLHNNNFPCVESSNYAQSQGLSTRTHSPNAVEGAGTGSESIDQPDDINNDCLRHDKQIHNVIQCDQDLAGTKRIFNEQAISQTFTNSENEKNQSTSSGSHAQSLQPSIATDCNSCEQESKDAPEGHVPDMTLHEQDSLTFKSPSPGCLRLTDHIAVPHQDEIVLSTSNPAIVAVQRAVTPDTTVPTTTFIGTDQEDTAFLHDFILRAKASKAARQAASPKKSMSDPNAIYNKVAEIIFAQHDPLATDDIEDTEMDLVGEAKSPQSGQAAGEVLSSPVRRSTRTLARANTRLSRPSNLPPVPQFGPILPSQNAVLPNTIQLKRATGTEFVFTAKAAQTLAMTTRSNTKRNQAGAVNVITRLAQIKAEQSRKDSENLTEALGSPGSKTTLVSVDVESPAKNKKRKRSKDEDTCRQPRKTVQWNEKLTSYLEIGSRSPVTDPSDESVTDIAEATPVDMLDSAKIEIPELAPPISEKNAVSAENAFGPQLTSNSAEDKQSNANASKLKVRKIRKVNNGSVNGTPAPKTRSQSSRSVHEHVFGSSTTVAASTGIPKINSSAIPVPKSLLPSLRKAEPAKGKETTTSQPEPTSEKKPASRKSLRGRS